MVPFGKMIVASRRSSFAGVWFIVRTVYDRIRQRVRLMRTVPLLVSICLILLWTHVCAIADSAQTISADCAAAQEQLKFAEAAAARSDWLTASNRYREAVQVAPACVEALVNLGVTYNKLNQSEEAIKTFQQALAKNPQLFVAHLNLGITYFRAAHYDLAKESLRNALKL